MSPPSVLDGSARVGEGPVRLALVGCGAVAELCHLPGALGADGVQVTAVVDRNPDRARILAERLGIERCAADTREVLDDVEGVINALPHQLHAPVSILCLEAGKAVLVEKPMARNALEARAMVAAARASGALLQVGLMNRFAPGTRTIKRAVDEGWLGALRSFEVEWGFVYDWPIASGFFFTPEAGGGVLLDLGSHVLDLLTWWFGPVSELRYQDDARGGVETNCEIALRLDGPGGPIAGTIDLSWTRALRNRVRVVGDRFTIECPIDNPVTYALRPTLGVDGVPPHRLLPDPSPLLKLEDVYTAQLESFARALRSGSPSEVPGEAALASLEIMDRCYRERAPLRFPWEA